MNYINNKIMGFGENINDLFDKKDPNIEKNAVDKIGHIIDFVNENQDKTVSAEQYDHNIELINLISEDLIRNKLLSDMRYIEKSDSNKKIDKLKNMIQYNLFGDPVDDICEENLETAALAFKLLSDDGIEIEDMENIQSILEGDNKFKIDFLSSYKN